MTKSTAIYKGDLHCLVTHGPSGCQIETDAPVDNGGKGEAFSPTDLVGAALSACMMTIMGIVAQRKGLDLKGIKIEVTKEMATTGERRIGKLSTVIEVPLPEDHPDRAALERAALTCPVHHSLHPEIEKPVEFRWIGSNVS